MGHESRKAWQRQRSIQDAGSRKLATHGYIFRTVERRTNMTPHCLENVVFVLQQTLTKFWIEYEGFKVQYGCSFLSSFRLVSVV